jgi:hypothetical protein
VTPPCSIHDGRLQALELEQATTEVRLDAGAAMFQAVREDVRHLEQRMDDGFRRTEQSIDRLVVSVGALTNSVADIRVVQAGHTAQLAELNVFRAKEERGSEKRWDMLRSWGPKAIGVAILVATGAKGHAILEYMSKILG